MAAGPWNDGIEVVEDFFENRFRDYRNAAGPGMFAAAPTWAGLPLAQPPDTQLLENSLSGGVAQTAATMRVYGGSLIDAPEAQRRIVTLGLRVAPSILIRDSLPAPLPPRAISWEWESSGFTVTAEIVDAPLSADVQVNAGTDVGSEAGVTYTDTIRVWRLLEPAYSVSGFDITWPSLDQTDFTTAIEEAAITHTYVTDVDGNAASSDPVSFSWDVTGASSWDEPSVHVLAVTSENLWSATDPFPATFAGLDVTWQFGASMTLASLEMPSRLKLRYSTPRYRWLYPDTTPPLQARGRDPRGFAAQGAVSQMPLQARARAW